MKNKTILQIKNLSVTIMNNPVIKSLSMEVPENSVVAIMGPSGCGKSTLIRSINRLHELTEGIKMGGQIIFNGKNIFEQEALLVRSQIGMVFQKPNPFPNMSIIDNVLSGYILTGKKINKKERLEIAEDALKKAFLWDEVKDRLFQRGTFLSGGQQQRLCIARSLALKVKLLLLDEPTSALDPKATSKIEELIEELKKEVTILIVTHNTSQASRISQRTAFMYFGDLVEYGKTSLLFTSPKDKRTEEYLMGKFG